MKNKKIMLIDSGTECVGMGVGLFFSLILIGAAASCDQYGVFYCSALVQAINNFIFYIGVTPKTHKRKPFYYSLALRGASILAAGMCIMYFVLLTSSPGANTMGNTWYTWLSWFWGGGFLTIAFLAAPILDSIIEGFAYAKCSSED